MSISNNDKRAVRYDGKHLYLKVDGKVCQLGTITTLKGRLTREQKLKAVAASGEWVEI